MEILRRRITPESLVLKGHGIEAFAHFYPDILLSELFQLSMTMPERKAKYDLMDSRSVPVPIIRAAGHIAANFGCPDINTAIIKRYIPGEQSDAFEMHQDPEEYQGLIYLSSLSGRARLSTFDPGFSINFSDELGVVLPPEEFMRISPPPISFVCKPNMIIALPADKLHVVTPPDPEFGSRGFLFFGHACKNILQKEIKAA